MLNSFEKNVSDTIQKYNMLKRGDRIVLGLSGGADSSALLCSLHKIYKNDITIIAVHLNHGIRGDEAKRDMLFSKSLAESFGVTFVSKEVSVPEYCKIHKMSEEAAGRKLRYAFFDEICRKYNCNKTAVAHNKNDKAETVLINLIRGSGVSGLCSIPPINGNIIRPLIETSRAEIEEYAKLNSIDFIIDSTNLSDKYTRNVIRNGIIPKMSAINRNAVENILRCSHILNTENEFIDMYVRKLNAVHISDSKVCILRSTFEGEHAAVQRRLILKAVEALAGNKLNVSSVQIESVLNSFKTGNMFCFNNGIKLVIENEYIVLSHGYANTDYEYFPEIPGTITVTQTGLTYRFELTSMAGLKEKNSIYMDYDKFKRQKAVLRTKKDGDRFNPSGMDGSKKIKKFFIDNKIPAEHRGNYPLLLSGSETAAVIPLRVSRNYTIDEHTKNILKITVTGGKNE